MEGGSSNPIGQPGRKYPRPLSPYEAEILRREKEREKEIRESILEDTEKSWRREAKARAEAQARPPKTPHKHDYQTHAEPIERMLAEDRQLYASEEFDLIKKRQEEKRAEEGRLKDASEDINEIQFGPDPVNMSWDEIEAYAQKSLEGRVMPGESVHFSSRFGPFRSKKDAEFWIEKTYRLERMSPEQLQSAKESALDRGLESYWAEDLPEDDRQVIQNYNFLVVQLVRKEEMRRRSKEELEGRLEDLAGWFHDTFKDEIQEYEELTQRRPNTRMMLAALYCDLDEGLRIISQIRTLKQEGGIFARLNQRVMAKKLEIYQNRVKRIMLDLDRMNANSTYIPSREQLDMNARLAS